MADMGINLSIGTDGAASNNALNMFREMYLATVLQKVSCDDAAAMPAEKVLEMATKGGALTMGLDDCDVLAKGKKADLVVLDLSSPNMQPVNNIAKNVVYSGSDSNVILTMCNGRILYENGEFTTIDTEKLISDANKAADRLKA
jgi:5-methylthioadenosine/S-adenosylhomocysteine deaminase